MSQLTPKSKVKPAAHAIPLTRLTCSACNVPFVDILEPPGNALTLNKIFLDSLEVEYPPNAHLSSHLRFCPPCALKLNELESFMAEMENLQVKVRNGREFFSSTFANAAFAKQESATRGPPRSNLLLSTLADRVIQKWSSKVQTFAQEEAPKTWRKILPKKTVESQPGNGEALAGPSTEKVSSASVNVKNSPSPKPNLPICQIQKPTSGNNSPKNPPLTQKDNPGQMMKGKTKIANTAPAQHVINVPSSKFVNTMFYDESSESSLPDSVLVQKGMDCSAGNLPVAASTKIAVQSQEDGVKSIVFISGKPQPKTLKTYSKPRTVLAISKGTVGMPSTSGTVPEKLKDGPLKVEMCVLCWKYIARGTMHFCGDKNSSRVYQCAYCNSVCPSEEILGNHVRQHMR